MSLEIAIKQAIEHLEINGFHELIEIALDHWNKDDVFYPPDDLPRMTKAYIQTVNVIIVRKNFLYPPLKNNNVP
jgi:hypothetical protein